MIKTFTPNDLLKCLYNEASVAEQEELQTALLCDENLREEWQSLQDSYSLLNGLMPQVSEKTCNNIMDYARAMNLARKQN
jgi:hypothetical protein